MEIEGIDYYFITTADYHNSEYVADYFKSREYFSGFTGSNGDLLVWADGAALWTDGRYFLQAEEELEGTGIGLMKIGEKGTPTVEEFIEKKMLPGQKLGCDGRCISINLGKKLAETAAKVNSKACKDAENPEDSAFIYDIDLAEKVWTDRPQIPHNMTWLLDEKITGQSRAARIEAVREKMKNEGADGMVLASLDDIAWMLLLRGSDIEYNPVGLAFLIMLQGKILLYTDSRLASATDDFLLDKDGVIIKPYKAIFKDIKEMRHLVSEEGKVLVDPDRLSYALYMELIEGFSHSMSDGLTAEFSDVLRRRVDASFDAKSAYTRVLCKQSPTVLMKAVKTKEEIECERQAHIKDGVAVTKFQYMLHCLREDEEFKSGKKTLTELEAAEYLLNLRKAQEGFLDQSFAPIIATAEHGAIIHYEPDEKSNATIKKDAFLLMDTGAQYMQGTTDITRTMFMGQPDEMAKQVYTAILMGNLELADAYFPEGTTGANLDILARRHLWRLGYDYKHGTGHGVGFLLNVHEGPQNISRRGRLGTMGTAFVPGMITSDEPGIYLPGRFGIRLENMMVCVEKDKTESDEFYGFETLTMVPFDRRSIEVSMMSENSINLLNQYNARVYETISEYLTEDERAWLREETAPINVQ